MSLRFHEISEANRRIQNPFSEQKLRLLGSICDISTGTTILDVACGKGEALCQWASTFDATGTGVDISERFIKHAFARADELNVSSQLTFEQADAANYPISSHDVDIACCIGASWIGGGLRGTLDLLDDATRDDTSLLVVGEAFWATEPPADAVQALANGDDEMFEALPGLSRTVENAGYELVEMVLANDDDWDRYEASQWRAVDKWIREHPDDPDGEEIRQWVSDNRRTYLRFGREYLGWGVFVVRHPPA